MSYEKPEVTPLGRGIEAIRGCYPKFVNQWFDAILPILPSGFSINAYEADE